MDLAGFSRRLRVGGVLALLTIAAVTLAEAGLLSWRIATAPARTQIIADSGLRRSGVMKILYLAQKPPSVPGWSVALTHALDDLEERQLSMNDLRGTDAAAYGAFIVAAQRFVLHPEPLERSKLDQLGDKLWQVYDARSKQYLAEARALRERVREEEFTTVGIILTVLFLLYCLVLKPAESYVVRAIDSLEDRRQRFAAMFDNSVEMMAIYDADGKIERANAAALGALGFGQEVIGKSFQVHIAPSQQAVAKRAFSYCIAGHAFEFETVFLDSSGQEVPVQAYLSPIVVSGKVVGVVGAARDVRAERKQELELVRSRERFRSIFDRSPNAVLGLSPEGMITDVNVEMERLSGHEARELIGKHASIIVPPTRREGLGERLAPALSGIAKTYESTIQRRDGTELNVLVDISPITVGGRIEGLFAVMRDVTNERLLETRVREQQDRVRALFLAATSPVDDAGAQIEAALSLGARACGVPYGLVSEIAEGKLVVRYRVGPDGLFPVGHVRPMSHSIGGRLLSLKRVLAVEDLTAEPWASEMAELKLPWKSYIGTPLFVHGAPYGVLTLMDVQPRERRFEQSDFEFVEVMGSMIATALARKRRETALHEKAFHDPLTGAANRALLEEHLHNAIARAHRTHERLALYYLDLDGFKPINDVYGHAAGDTVLCEIVRRLSLAVREYDLVARIGGDEFIVLQSGIIEDSAIEAMTRRLRRVADVPIELSQGKSVRVTVSLGLAIYPDDANNVGDLLKAADVAMYRRKELLKREAFPGNVVSGEFGT